MDEKYFESIVWTPRLNIYIYYYMCVSVCVCELRMIQQQQYINKWRWDPKESPDDGHLLGGLRKGHADERRTQCFRVHFHASSTQIVVRPDLHVWRLDMSNVCVVVVVVVVVVWSIDTIAMCLFCNLQKRLTIIHSLSFGVNLNDSKFTPSMTLN